MRDVLLIGMGITAPSALESLAANCRVVGVVRTVDPNDIDTDPVIESARRHGIPVFGDASISGIRELVGRLRPECVVISSFDRILPGDLVAGCPYVNIHYSPLPRYRGRANVNWALINGEPFTAITIHIVEEGLDAGNVLFQRLVPIDREDTVADLYERLNQLQLQHLGETVDRFLNGYAGIPQTTELATYGCTRLPADGEIDWGAPTDTIAALIRALVKPFPGAFSYINGRRLVVWGVRALDNPPSYVGRVPGRVVNVSKAHGYVDVLTGDGVLRILEVEVNGEGPVDASQLIRSLRSTLGLRTADLLSRIELLEREIAVLRGQAPSSGENHAHM
jgi:methionyl-tRNA formyltransferase